MGIKPILLLVADGRDAFEKLPPVLRSGGFPVGAVSNIQEALVWLEKNEVDALILDEAVSTEKPRLVIESLRVLRPDLEVIPVLRDLTEGRCVEWMSAGSAFCIPRLFPPESLGAILLCFMENRLLRSQTLETEKQGRGAFGARSGFLTTLSYEIKAPMTTIAGATKMLLGRGGLDKPGQLQTAKNLELVEMIKRNSDRILGFIGDVLDLERMRQGDFKWDAKIVAPSALLDEAFGKIQKSMEELQVRAVRKPNRFPPDEDFGKWMLCCDREQIGKVLQLLSLACGHTVPKPREVSTALTAEAGETRVTFWVEGDSGGIENRELKNVFELFRDLDVSEGRKDTYGLSMNICKRLVELNGGRIWAESEGVGKKLRYAFSLPAKVV